MGRKKFDGLVRLRKNYERMADRELARMLLDSLDRTEVLVARSRAEDNADNARYRAAKLQACPAWADQDAIRAVYELRAWFTDFIGIEYDVDHVVPLQHPLVSGLHVPANLEVITASENRSKNNRWWPDMPD